MKDRVPVHGADSQNATQVLEKSSKHTVHIYMITNNI